MRRVIRTRKKKEKQKDGNVRREQDGWGLLKTSYPVDFANFKPKKNEEDLFLKKPLWCVDGPDGNTVAQGFKDKRAAKEYMREYCPGGFIRCYNPRVSDHEKNLSEGRQERRFQSLSSGSAVSMYSD